MTAYYNENEPYCAEWLRNLIAAGHIAPGVVDERDIRDVRPDELAIYTQCHFFAGIGGWSLALRLAGWPDSRPVWTGSCPCQPFSAAGRGAGFADERHLWPAWFHIITQCHPSVVFGEQVASKDGLKWLDLVQTDMEATHYSFGKADLCAAGIEAPHIRQRLGFVAYAENGRRDNGIVEHAGRHGPPIIGVAGGERVGVVAYADSGASGQGSAQPCGGDHGSDAQQGARLGGGGSTGALAHDERAGLEEQREQQARGERAATERSGAPGCLDDGERDGRRSRRRDHGQYDRQQFDAAGAPGIVADADGGHARAEWEQRGGQHGQQPQNGGLAGPWRGADWVYCVDEAWRPTEPGSFPLAYGVSNRVGKLRAYGNAIVPQVFAEFIAASREALGEDGVMTLRDMLG